jgi:hypothetical protein
MSQADRIANHVEPSFHPVSHYDSPDDVLNDARLATDEKRVILSSWASDMYVRRFAKFPVSRTGCVSATSWQR